MNIDRFVLAFAGSLVVISAALAQLLSPYWLLLTGFVGLNLVQASLTRFCPLAMVLQRLGVPAGSAFSRGDRQDRKGRGSMSEQIKMAEPATVMEWVQTGQATVVDVRESGEYANGHIPGATLVPLSVFDAGQVPVDPAKKLVFHCQSGMRCGPASAKMVESGYKGEIHRMRGGFKAWTEAGGPVSRD